MVVPERDFVLCLPFDRRRLAVLIILVPGPSFRTTTEKQKEIQPHGPRNINHEFNFATMDIQDDGLKSFGEGFDGFPKRLPEDCVEYTLFVVDSKLKNQKELLARLEAVRKESSELTASLLKTYIWQRESFKLELEREKGRSPPRLLTK